MSARFFLSVLLAASTVLAAPPPTLTRRDGPTARIQAFGSSDCSGKAVYNPLVGPRPDSADYKPGEGHTQPYVDLDGDKMYCHDVRGSKSVKVTGSGCRTYFYKDAQCTQDAFDGFVKNSDCMSGIQGYAVDCSETAFDGPTKSVVVMPPSASYSGLLS